VPVRLLQNHLGDLKKRIRPARDFDLARQGIDALFFRAERDVHIGQRDRGFASFARLVPIRSRLEFSFCLERWPAAIALRRSLLIPAGWPG
jgi:hypothetical protein